MHLLTPDLINKSSNDDLFFAARSENGNMILAGQHGSMSVPGSDIKLGQRFFVVNGALFSEDEWAERGVRVQRLGTVANNIGFIGKKKIVSYSQLLKKKKPRKHR